MAAHTSTNQARSLRRRADAAGRRARRLERQGLTVAARLARAERRRLLRLAGRL